MAIAGADDWAERSAPAALLAVPEQTVTMQALFATPLVCVRSSVCAHIADENESTHGVFLGESS